MRREYLFLELTLVCLFFMVSATAQSPEQKVRMIESNRTEFYFGHGYADDYDQALQKAKANLVSDISVYVAGRATGTISNAGVQMEEVINTYTNMTQLREVESFTLEPSDVAQYHVFCYLTRASVEGMFAERKQKVLDYFTEAQKAESRLQLTDALQYYYWSLLIARTLPDGDAVKVTMEDGTKQNLLMWLNRHIPEMMENIDFRTVAVTGDDSWKQVELAVTYKGKPVANCDYKYWTGHGFSQPVRVRDGRGIAEFSDVPENLQIMVEYVFENEARNIDPQLRDIISLPGRPSWKANAHAVRVEIAEKKQESAVAANEVTATADQAAAETKKTAQVEKSAVFKKLGTEQQAACTKMMNQVKSAIKTRNYTSAAPLFTKEAWDLFSQILKGKVSVIGEPQWTFLQTKDAILCRCLPLSLSYPRSGKTVVENVEFRIDPETMKINSFSYLLNQEAEADILDSKKKWEDNSRLQIMQFLQNYQTAYALKRADYLESVFSDDALIIVGTKVKQAPNLENRINIADKQMYTYVQSTKEEFISALRRVFASAEFVNLQLKDNEIIKAGKEEIYGIQIRQLYASNNYADEGYLFLVVDLRNPAKPIIHVRTWQPEKDPEFGLFDLSKFSFN